MEIAWGSVYHQIHEIRYLKCKGGSWNINSNEPENSFLYYLMRKIASEIHLKNIKK